MAVVTQSSQNTSKVERLGNRPKGDIPEWMRQRTENDVVVQHKGCDDKR